MKIVYNHEAIKELIDRIAGRYRTLHAACVANDLLYPAVFQWRSGKVWPKPEGINALAAAAGLSPTEAAEFAANLYTVQEVSE